MKFDEASNKTVFEIDAITGNMGTHLHLSILSTKIGHVYCMNTCVFTFIKNPVWETARLVRILSLAKLIFFYCKVKMVVNAMETLIQFSKANFVTNEVKSKLITNFKLEKL